jgi:hypothetical protein
MNEQVLPNPDEFISSGISKCKKCNHIVCPHCKDWCDAIANTKEQIKEFGINVSHVKNLDDEQEYPILCCDGECVFK